MKLKQFFKKYFLIVSPFIIISLICVAVFVFKEFKFGYNLVGDTALYNKQHQLIPGGDFKVLYFAAKHWAAGEDIYNTNGKYTYFPEEAEHANSGGTSFVYPPSLAVLYYPLLFLPSFTAAYFFYSIFTFVLFILSVLVIAKNLKNKSSFIFLALVLFIFSPIFLLHLERGQSDIIILTLITLAFYFFVHKKSLTSGALIGLAALLKLTPFIFLPYLFIRDKRAFYSAASIIVLGSAALGVNLNLLFLKNLSSFASGFSSGISSNSFLGVIYNKYSFHLMSFAHARLISLVILLPILGYFFYSFYWAKKNKISTDSVLLMEFGVLLSCMVFVPSVSWVYNGVHLLFLLAAYWNLRPLLLNRHSYWLVLIQDFLFFMIFSLPSLFLFSPAVTKYFSMRALYVLIISVFVMYLTLNFAKKKEAMPVSE